MTLLKHHRFVLFASLPSECRAAPSRHSLVLLAVLCRSERNWGNPRCGRRARWGNWLKKMAATTAGRFPVFLNVYEEAQWFNKYLNGIGLGVYHTAVEVHGVEYAFGTHGKSTSGIYPSEPRKDDLLPDTFKFKESLLLGYTDHTRDDVRAIITELGRQFRGNQYQYIRKNCNSFSSHLAQLLCNRELPSWVNRAARFAGSVPLADRLFVGKQYGNM